MLYIDKLNFNGGNYEKGTENDMSGSHSSTCNRLSAGKEGERKGLAGKPDGSNQHNGNGNMKHKFCRAGGKSL